MHKYVCIKVDEWRRYVSRKASNANPKVTDVRSEMIYMAVYLSMLFFLPSIIYSYWDACDFVIGPYPMITHAPPQVL